jgi:polygalacturonase
VRGRTRLIALSAAGVLGLAAVATPMIANAAISAAPKTLDVKAFGAKGDGNADDAAATNKAIAAAPKGAVIEYKAGTYKIGSTVHLKSNTTIQVDKGATLVGTSSGYDKAEANPNDKYQDYGHSHFHNAMFYGDGLSNIAFTGGGTIDGGGHFITGNPKSGQADKLISLTRCTNLTLSNITLKRGGHFAALINGCNGVTSDHLTISTASDRDGWNIINTQNVTITNINDAANDDALVFKSDWALGKKYFNGHVRVTNAHLSAGCCNALMFGSETCGDFSDYVFQDITITKAGKSGLGMVSMDGANISDVHYKHVTMSGTQSPIMEKIGTRRRCGNSPGIGSIKNITYEDVTGTKAGAYSPTLWGQSGHLISNVTFTNVKLTVPGGHGTMGTGVPSDTGDYNPRSLGTRPAYGWYLHNVSGISFHNSSVAFDSNDGRPAFLANSGSDIKLDNFGFEKGSGSPFDIGFQNISGYCVNGSGSPRVSATGSSKAC